MLDLKISGGALVDGSGSGRRRGDLGIAAGRIVALGDVPERAHATLDARGKIVAPGFVDLHTHYDAQVFWDGSLSPSSYHGVTSIVGGNCGFSIAPLCPEQADYLMRMLARVEGMPLESLRAGVPWNWRSFGEYLDRLEGRLALNAGFLVGHSAVRSVVMGERAIAGPARDDELRRMQDLLHRSLAEGGLGFSSSISPAHNDAEGQSVPSRRQTSRVLLDPVVFPPRAPVMLPACAGNVRAVLSSPLPRGSTHPEFPSPRAARALLGASRRASAAGILASPRS